MGGILGTTRVAQMRLLAVGSAVVVADLCRRMPLVWVRRWRHREAHLHRLHRRLVVLLWRVVRARWMRRRRRVWRRVLR